MCAVCVTWQRHTCSSFCKRFLSYFSYIMGQTDSCGHGMSEG